MKINTTLALNALESGEGILRLAPAWVPRSFQAPGGRLKLAKNDLYALGAKRGGIDERWLASTIGADNGPGTPDDEGLSYVVLENGGRTKKLLFKDLIELMGDRVLGSALMNKYQGWPVLAKLFDNLGPLPHHLHQTDESAARVGKYGKPEAYYFPVQLNSLENNFPYSFLGLDPSTTQNDIKNCLANWYGGDNGILNYSQAYKLKPGTGWDIPAGVLHAPGSLVTYEVQRSSDVFSMFQSVVDGRFVAWDMVIKDVPAEFHHDLDYLVSLIDWQKNVDPFFKKHHFLIPLPVRKLDDMLSQGYTEMWIIYGSEYFSGQELTVFPGQSIRIHDEAPYGLIVIQGHGTIGKLSVEAPTLIRFGDLTTDELFVTAAAAGDVKIVNSSHSENLVMLKHFGPGKSGVPGLTD